MAITRRALIRNGAMAVVGTAAIPSFLTRSVLAAESADGGARRQRMVVLFQRGAADGLNIVVPHAESFYYQARPGIAIPRNQVLDLDGFFGLHPALGELKPLWERKELAIIHAAGSPDPTRSHFDAQDYMESGTPGYRATTDGWLNRALAAEDERRRRAESPFRAVSMGPDVALTLRGRVPAMAMTDVADFSVGGSGAAGGSASAGGPGAREATGAAGATDGGLSAEGALFRTLYDSSSSSLLRATGRETFEAVKMLRATDPAHYVPANGAVYPAGRFGESMRQIAQMLKADLGVEAAFADIEGWDHHVNEGNVEGQLARSLREFSQGIAAFWQDLGDEGETVTLVSLSEFGRTVRQNGTGGTDHGHANAMFVLGGQVQGGRVYGKWPGLEPEQLYQARDLAVTTDYRLVLAEAVRKQLGARDLKRVFPQAELGRELGYLPERV